MVSNFTAFAVVAHLLLGCCWHHGHLCRHDSRDADRLPHAGAGAGAEACGHEGHACPALVDGEHHRQDTCNGTPCSFLAGRPVRVATESAVTCGPVAAVAAPSMADLPAQLSIEAKFLTATQHCPPLRPHLVFEVLLL
jgi:hypothetical protein